jgi:alkane 1-monooxygenase
MPFWMSLGLIPVAILAAIYGGWFIAMLPLSTWYLFSAPDYVVGKNTDNTEIDTPEEHLFWYRLITLVWPPLQVATIFGILAYGTATDHLVGWEEWALFAALGILSGTVGITYSHELMHQKPWIERWLADILLASVLYAHFRSEHLLVHQRYVGTRRDPV